MGVPADIGGSKHGTQSGYSRGCRCDDCRTANRENHRAYKRSRGVKEFRPAEHGTASKYNRGCRCPACREAARARSAAKAEAKAKATTPTPPPEPASRPAPAPRRRKPEQAWITERRGVLTINHPDLPPLRRADLPNPPLTRSALRRWIEGRTKGELLSMLAVLRDGRVRFQGRSTIKGARDGCTLQDASGMIRNRVEALRRAEGPRPLPPKPWRTAQEHRRAP